LNLIIAKAIQGYAIIDLDTNKNVGFKNYYDTLEEAKRDIDCGNVVPF
jgi:hypothetical protein